jgi:cellulose synthase/poly-beta-1,6-N-acetylglucosamine synthase-like glycosyltransferase
MRAASINSTNESTNNGANGWIRQTHRWLSIAFTLTVIANFAARTRGEPAAWLTYSPLLPLAFLLLSGLYLFFVPYVSRWRSGQ